MMNGLSLRARLTFVILIPLLVIAAMVGAWAYRDAQENAAERFDRSLLSTALAISGDMAATGGDALVPFTRDLLRDTSGGAVFYHVYAPDGVFVTGYATPPVAPDPIPPEAAQTYFDAIYQGAPVRALRFVQNMSIDGLTGPFTFTVWQNTSVRDGFVQSRTRPVFLIIAAMIGALAVIVWFGVRLGLYPLVDLEEAIARRSASDLSPIQRRIPPEVRGIVGGFNALLSELSRTLDAKNVFISDAAHQLCNPIAGVMSLAESVQNAKTLDDAKGRGADLLDAAREAGTLADSLLTLERAQATPLPERQEHFDPVALLQSLSTRFTPSADKAGVRFDAKFDVTTANLFGDPVMFEQAVLNVLNNALFHGGAALDEITLQVIDTGPNITIRVTDNGVGIAPQHHAEALGRFSQIGPSKGSGLGLPISKAIAESFGGQLSFAGGRGAFSVNLTFPQQTPNAAKLAAQ